MAVKSRGKKPAATTKAEGELIMSDVVKLTVSVKRRLANGDEIFIAPGMERHHAPGEAAEARAALQEDVDAWLTELLEAYPDVDLDEDDDDGDYDDDEDADDEDDEDEDDVENGEDEDDVPSEEEIAKMKVADLKALVEDYELDVDPKGMKVKELREAVIDALYGEDEDDDDVDDDDQDDDEDDEDEITEEDLEEMSVSELEELCEENEIDLPKYRRGAKAAAKKKALIAHILEVMEEEE